MSLGKIVDLMPEASDQRFFNPGSSHVKIPMKKEHFFRTFIRILRRFFTVYSIQMESQFELVPQEVTGILHRRNSRPFSKNGLFLLSMHYSSLILPVEPTVISVLRFLLFWPSKYYRNIWIHHYIKYCTIFMGGVSPWNLYL